MARRKGDSPQKAALREMMSSFMKDNDVHIKDQIRNSTKYVICDNTIGTGEGKVKRVKITVTEDCEDVVELIF